MPSLRRELVTDGLLAMLQTDGVLPFLVGDANAPKAVLQTDGQERPNVPYAVLYPLPGGDRVGASMSDSPESAIVWIYQVTVVAKFRGAAEFAQDKVHAAILDRAAGHFVNPILVADDPDVVRLRQHDSFGPTEPAGDLFSAIERFRVGTASA